MYNKVYVEITNICNMSCSFCHGHKREARQMSREEFSLILDKPPRTYAAVASMRKDLYNEVNL